jgi:hypothetical protein
MMAWSTVCEDYFRVADNPPSISSFVADNAVCGPRRAHVQDARWLLDLQTPPRLSEKIIEHRVFQCNFACAVGRQTSTRHLHGVKNENEATMQGASILSPALQRSAYDWIGNSGSFICRTQLFV